MVGPYSTDEAFRAALEERLRRRARESGRPLGRLRKEVAHQRLLARIAAVASPGTWALKGGLALLARLEDRARATSDADANQSIRVFSRSARRTYGSFATAWQVKRDWDLLAA